MKLSAVTLARTLAYVESLDLNPRGKIFGPDLIRALVERYSFQKYPKSIEDLDETKGVEFHVGRAGNRPIQKFVIWDSLLVLETRISTTDSKEIIEEILTWGVEKFGINYQPAMIKHYAFVSDLSFYSDVPLLNVNPILTKLAAKTGQALSEIWHESIQYEPITIAVGHDPTARKYGIAPFSITRRAEAKFSENKYYSEAPLPTDLHIKFLEQYEAELSAK